MSRCPFCDLLVPEEDWASHTSACSGLPYHPCCDCWGNGHTCPVVDFGLGYLCSSCFEDVPTRADIFNHPCITYCRFCAERNQDDMWDHLCTKNYEERMAMEEPQAAEPMEEEDPNSFEIRDRTSMEGLLHELTFTPRGTYISVNSYMDAIRHELYTRTRNLENGKYLVRVEILFERPMVNEDVEMELSRWETLIRNAQPSGELQDFERWIRDITAWLDQKIEEYTKLTSGWRVRSIDTFTFSHTIFRRIDGGAPIIIIPKYFRGSKARWIRVLEQEPEERVRRLDGSISLRENSYCFMLAVLICLAYQDSDPSIRKKVKECRMTRWLRKMKLNERYHLNFKIMDDQGLFGTDKLRAFGENNNIIVRCYTHTTKDHVSGFAGPLYVNTKVRSETTRVVHLMRVTDMDSENPKASWATISPRWTSAPCRSIIITSA